MRDPGVMPPIVHALPSLHADPASISNVYLSISAEQ